MEELQQKWEEIKELCKKEYDILDVSYKTWIFPLQIHSVEGNLVKILVPEDISKNYINKKFNKELKVTIYEVIKKEYDLEFISPNELVSSYKSDTINTNYNNSNIEKANLNSKYTFDTFVVGSNNRFAHSASLAVSESPGDVYNPLFLHGGPGLGKTHLMHSIGHYIMQQNPNMNVLYVTSETFTNEVIESIRSGNQAMTKFREKYRNIDVLLLDDVQFIIGKESTQEEFFHTFNELHSSKKQIVLSSDKPPRDMETLEERLRSRFEWGLIADIAAPDYETRMAILRKNAESSGIFVDDEIIQYIATNVKSNIRELEGAFNRLIALAKLDNKEINISTAEEALRDIISPNSPQKITLDLILEVVSNYYSISVSDLSSKKRNQEVVTPRQVCMFLGRELTDVSLIDIAKKLGKKDHSTVINGHKKVLEIIEENGPLADDIDKIRKILNAS